MDGGVIGLYVVWHAEGLKHAVGGRWGRGKYFARTQECHRAFGHLACNAWHADMAEACSEMQVGRENPSELKAAKLARGMARGVEDRDLKPNTQERQQIEVVIVGPPNRHAPLHRKDCCITLAS